jgi:hypothetical protein
MIDADTILNLEMQRNDAGASTIREYLVTLLKQVWIDGEGFDGKRPFGNSGWECDLFVPLVKAGLIEGFVDSDGYLDECDDDTGEDLIRFAIGSLA